MSSEKFESLEDDLNNILIAIFPKIDEKLNRSTGEERKKTLREIEREIEDATTLIDELDKEARKAPQPFRSQMTYKVRSHRDDITKINSKLKQVNSSENYTRQELFDVPSNSILDPVEASQRARLLQTGDIINRTSASLGRTHQIAAETDEIGTEIVEELGQQRESLIRTKDRLIDTNAELSKSRKILKLMNRRVITNKLILVIIILFEIGILIGLIYWKFIK